MKILGLLLIAFGAADLIGSYSGFDLWGEVVGIQLPGMIWKYSSYIEIGLGYFLFTLGKSDNDSEAEAEAE